MDNYSRREGKSALHVHTLTNSGWAKLVGLFMQASQVTRGACLQNTRSSAAGYCMADDSQIGKILNVFKSSTLLLALAW